MPSSLQLFAGPAARTFIRENGLRAQDVTTLVAASGGPKWLTLFGLDRVLFGEFFTGRRSQPLHLVGSSIGSWRMACLAQRDPLAALERFREAYIAQAYSPHPSPPEVSRVTAGILDELLADGGSREILENHDVRLHVITARSRGLVRSERKRVLMAGLVVTALANIVSRRALGLQFERVVFSNAGNAGLLHDYGSVPTRYKGLTSDNLRAVLLASGSIPLVLEGVNVPGAKDSLYRDGGVLDYHPVLAFRQAQGIVLYPHFYSHLTPGWFDQWLPWRQPQAADLDRVVLLAPTPEFVASLPHAKIPDRKDFYRYDDAERRRAWRAVCAASERLGDEFRELRETGDWLDRVQPFPGTT